MDPISQASLGALVAQAAAPRQLGPRELLWGAAAGALPDIDVVFGLGGDAFDSLLTHRGFTHSLVFPLLVGPLIGAWVWHRSRDPALRSPDLLGRWMICMTLAVLSHRLLDLLTPYGTQLLLPFSDARFAINAMPIIEPVYTLVLVAGVFAAFVWHGRRSPARIATAALALSCTYLAYGFVLNERARDEGVRQLVTLGEDGFEVAAFPTLLQLHYRRVVARRDNEIRVGYVTVWEPCEIEWGHYTEPSDIRFDAVRGTREGSIFEWFAMGYATYAVIGDHVRVADLRYGVDIDPRRSLFQLTALFDPVGRLRAAPTVGRNAQAMRDRGLTGLLAAAYDEQCSAADVRVASL